MNKFYSQNGEDYLLSRFFDDVETGFFVDVGAFDGVHLSNTYFFEQQDWSGICIEPNPRYYRLCKRQRPDSICINAACVGEENIETIEFYAEELGLLSGVRGDRVEDVRRRYEGRGLEFKGFEKTEVPASTLNIILRQNLPDDTVIDFISVDVEGTEMDVLQGLDLSRFRPRVLVVESNSGESRAALHTYLVEMNGYVEARSLGVNVFYTREPEDARELNTTEVNCEITRNLHPRGEKYTLREFISGKSIRPQRQAKRQGNFLRRIVSNRLSSSYEYAKSLVSRLRE